ncbi:MAG TPA: AraC family transcriptional regulator [Bacillota bacterium]|nr:AraC family transcriptional regulator [Bacillota bacterium]
MFEDLLPAVEKSILESSGSIPVVFEGIEHCFEKTTPVATSSRHTSHELLYLRKGAAEFTINGKTVMLSKGSTLIIRPQVNHAIRVPEGQADMVVLYFGFSSNLANAQAALRAKPKDAQPMANGTLRGGPTVPVFPENVSSSPLESFIDFAMGEKDAAHDQSHLIISGKSRQAIGDLVERIMRESRSDAYAKDMMMQFLAMELLVTLSRALREEWEESLAVKHGKARELVLIARDFIEENYNSGISVVDASSYVFLSQGYFTRAFRDELGMSPMSYLMQVRIKAACKLLEQKEIKVSGIASQVGFSSPQRFNVVFRKQMGMTPMEYRRMHTK